MRARLWGVCVGGTYILLFLIPIVPVIPITYHVYRQGSTLCKTRSVYLDAPYIYTGASRYITLPCEQAALL